MTKHIKSDKDLVYENKETERLEHGRVEKDDIETVCKITFQLDQYYEKVLKGPFDRYDKKVHLKS